LHTGRLLGRRAIWLGLLSLLLSSCVARGQFTVFTGHSSPAVRVFAPLLFGVAVALDCIGNFTLRGFSHLLYIECATRLHFLSYIILEKRRLCRHEPCLRGARDVSEAPRLSSILALLLHIPMGKKFCLELAHLCVLVTPSPLTPVTPRFKRSMVPGDDQNSSSSFNQTSRG